MKSISVLIMLTLMSTTLHAQRVTELFEKGKFEKAEKYCSKQKGEMQAVCYKELAEAYYSMEDYDKAAIFYGKTDNPKEGYLNIADAYLAEEHYEKASIFYEKTDNPSKNLLKIAEIYLDNKEYENAAVLYSKTKNPMDGYLKIAGALYLEEKYESAASFYEKTDNPDSGYLKIAEACIDKKEYEKAADYFARTGDPNTGYKRIARIYLLNNNQDKAKEYYTKTVDNPTEYLVNTWIYSTLIREFNYSFLLANRDQKLMSRLNEILKESQEALGKDMVIKLFESVHKEYQGKWLDLMDAQRNGKSVRQYDIELNMKIALYLNTIVVKLKNG